MVDQHMIELRGMAPREFIDILDAVSASRRMARIELVNEILGEWCERRVHEAQAICSVTRGNGSSTEAARK